MLQDKHVLFQVIARSGYPPPSGNTSSEDLPLPGDSGDHTSIFGLLMVSWCLGEDRTMCKGETGLSMSRPCSIAVGFHSVRGRHQSQFGRPQISFCIQASPASGACRCVSVCGWVCMLSKKSAKILPVITFALLYSHIQSFISLDWWCYIHPPTSLVHSQGCPIQKPREAIRT